MIVDARVWTPDADGKDGTEYEGDVVIEVLDDEEVQIALRVDGEVIASGAVDRFAAGVLVGQIAHAASEAVKS